MKREKLGCINSPFPHSFQYLDNRIGSRGERVTSDSTQTRRGKVACETDDLVAV